MKLRLLAIASTATLFTIPATAGAGGLRGSATSMREQHKVAVDRELEFIDDAAHVRQLVASGGLDTIASNDDYMLSDVSFPYALPEVRLFIERLGKQFHEANGSRLVITSLTRPTDTQPRNAHELSVHPAGMAVDFRVPADAKARSWLESALLQLENRGLLDVTRERFPPHYHVAVFPAAYARYVEKQAAAEQVVAEPRAQPALAEVKKAAVAPALPAPSQSRSPMLLFFAIGTGGVAAVAAAARRLNAQSSR